MKTGDKCVCINDGGALSGNLIYHGGMIAEGEVYCVEGVTDFTFDRNETLPSLFLVGMRRTWIEDGREVPYPAEWFRPVSEVRAENRAKRRKLQPATD